MEDFNFSSLTPVQQEAPSRMMSIINTTAPLFSLSSPPQECDLNSSLFNGVGEQSKDNDDTTDIFYTWEKIEGDIVRKLKIIADSHGENLPCYACNAKSFNVPNYPEVLCDNFSQYKPYSETKCVKGVLQWRNVIALQWSHP